MDIKVCNRCLRAAPGYRHRGFRCGTGDNVRTLTEHLEKPGESDKNKLETPTEWDENEAEWEDKLETAREKSDITASKGTLTTLYQHYPQ